MAQSTEVAVIGLRALNRDINKLADDRKGPLVRVLAQAGKAAAEPVAVATRAALPRNEAGPTPGALVDDVRTSGTRTGATVRMGRKKIPWAGWVEFGGRRTRPHESSRDFVRTGRYLFPSARNLAQKAAETYAAAVESGLNSFSWSNETTSAEQVHD